MLCLRTIAPLDFVNKGMDCSMAYIGIGLSQGTLAAEADSWQFEVTP
jgi:hypothetical protein